MYPGRRGTHFFLPRRIDSAETRPLRIAVATVAPSASAICGRVEVLPRADCMRERRKKKKMPPAKAAAQTQGVKEFAQLRMLRDDANSDIKSLIGSQVHSTCLRQRGSRIRQGIHIPPSGALGIRAAGGRRGIWHASDNQVWLTSNLP